MARITVSLKLNTPFDGICGELGLEATTRSIKLNHNYQQFILKLENIILYYQYVKYCFFGQYGRIESCSGSLHLLVCQLNFKINQIQFDNNHCLYLNVITYYNNHVCFLLFFFSVRC